VEDCLIRDGGVGEHNASVIYIEQYQTGNSSLCIAEDLLNPIVAIFPLVVISNPLAFCRRDGRMLTVIRGEGQEIQLDSINTILGSHS